MTKDELAEGLRICEAATEGPWTNCGSKGSEICGVQLGKTSPHRVTCHKFNDGPKLNRDVAKANATFIAYARTALPKALKENATWAREFHKLQGRTWSCGRLGLHGLTIATK